MNWIQKIIASFCVTLAIGSGVLFYIRGEARELRVQRDAAARLLRKQDIAVTVVEGKRREEIAVLMEAKGICTAAEFLTASLSKEGMLFPDTYRFFPDTPAATVVDTLVANYKTKTVGKVPTQDQLILASIVEREAAKDEDRALIAGIYSNRMRIGMKLDADPTVQYAKDSQSIAGGADIATFDFWKPITVAEYASVISYYNTYLQPGWPPGPISNPGLKSIEAAMSPQAHDYFYFLQSGGKTYPAKTIQEHNRNKLR